MFTGVSAFPLTPAHDGELDERAFTVLIERLAGADVESIAVLGTTGSGPYFDVGQRARAAALAVENADGTPVVVGVGALSTRDVLANVRNADSAGAAGLLLAPVSYQPLTDDDVVGLFEAVVESSDLPIIVYDNPATTGFTFSIELYGRLAQLPTVASIKIPPLPVDLAEARARVDDIRSVAPPTTTIGISGDGSGVRGLIAGCDVWYSAIGGLLPEMVVGMYRAVREGRIDEAEAETRRLQPLWDLFAEHGGSVRVISAMAEELGLAGPRNLPLPVRGLDPVQRDRIRAVMRDLDL